MRRNRNSKIVATLGPASSTIEVVRALFSAGADVFRLNFSHGTHADHEGRMEHIREVERESGRPIGVMLDLQGPKLRLGAFRDGPVRVRPGDVFRLDLEPRAGDAGRVTLPHPEVFAIAQPGNVLLVDDGRVRLRIRRCGPDFAETEVVVGGELSDRKGVNVPGVVLPIEALTAKDRRDLELGLELGVDWVALSFVQRPEDFTELTELVAGRAGIVAKLEKPSALERLHAIVEACDAVMVARGDLGVELPPERVPGAQKRIIRVCRDAGKPVVVATQMLDSMMRSPVPTRAEASDVATAVYDGADAVMLSGETASGEFPLESVAMMDRILVEVERDPHYLAGLTTQHLDPEPTIADAISFAVQSVAGTLSAAAVVTYTSSGSSALRVARERPGVPILGLTPNIDTARRLALAWGVHSVHGDGVADVQEMVERACRAAVEEGFAVPGQRLVIAAGMPFGTPGTTNLLRVARVSGKRKRRREA